MLEDKKVELTALRDKLNESFIADTFENTFDRSEKIFAKLISYRKR